jgi:hypothetical protein
MFAGFCLGATARGFADAFSGSLSAFIGALFFGGMAAARVFPVGVWWMEVREKEWRAGEISGGGKGTLGENIYTNRLCV